MAAANDFRKQVLEMRWIIDPVAILLEGDPDTVAVASQQAIEKAGQDGAFILGSGCEVAQKTPLENLIAMRETGRRFRYAEVN